MFATTNTTAKVAAIVASLGLVAMSFASFAPSAKAAMSTADMEAMIASLQAQLAALNGSSGANMSTSQLFTSTMTIGATGPEVTTLQNWLIKGGYAIPAGATGYFGAQTASALAAFQKANGITPAVGYFGAITRAKVNAMLGAMGNTGNGSTSVNSGAGRLTNVDSAGDVESDLKEGDSVTKVIGVTADAKDGDVQVQRVDVEFDLSTSTGSSRLDKYIQSAAVYLDGKKLATMDAADADRESNGIRTMRFANLNGVIKNGKTGNLYVEVTPVSTVAAAEDGQTITASIPDDGIRAIGGDGISETYGTSLDTENFTVSTATDGTATISESTSNPDDSVVKADPDTTTEDVTLLAFGVKAKKQDITVHDFAVQLGSTHSISDTVQSVKLMSGSTVLKSKTISSTASTVANVVFDNVDADISKDDTSNYTVVATVRKVDATTFVSGDTLVASTTGALAYDVEDSDGASVTPSGSAIGGVVTLQQTAVTVVKTAATVTSTVTADPGTPGSYDQKTYSISFKVTAGDDDLYIDRSVQNIMTPVAVGGGVAWATTSDSGAAVTGTTTTNFSAADTNSSDTATTYKIPSGSSRTFTLNVTLAASADGYTGVQLTGINYDVTPNNGANAQTLYFTSNLDTFKTATTFMNVI